MHVGTLLRFGGWVTVSSLVGPLMVIGDRFIIGAIANAKAVAYYTIPFQLGERSAVIPSSLASALFPRLTGSAPPEARRMALDSLDMLVTVMTPLIAGAILLIGPFLTWWIDPQFASHSTRVGQVILLGFWVNSFAKIPYAQLQARGRPDLVATCHLSELLPYFLLLYVGMHLFGLLGAAIAYSIRVLLDFLLLAGFAGVLGETLPRLAAPALLLTAAMAVAVWLPSGSPAWFAASFLGLLATTAWTWHWAPVRLRSRALALLGSKRVEAND